MKTFLVEFATDEDKRTNPNYEQGYFKITGELIRCKDCKYYDGYYCHNKYWGDGNGYYTPPIKKEDGHCDWAERKE